MNEIKKFFVISKYNLISFARDKIELFFAFIFPVILIVIFGTAFGGENTQTLKLGVLESDYSILKEIKGVEIVEYENLDELKAAVKKEDVDMGVQLSEKGIVVFKNQSNNNSEIAMSIILPKIKAVVIGGADRERVELKVKRIYVGKRKGKYIDYISTGTIVMSFFNTAVFTTINIIGRQKKEKIFNKFLLTPIRSYTLVFGFLFGIISMNFISTIFIIFISNILFKANLVINIFLFIPYFLALNIGSIGFGIFLLLIFKRRETALSVASFYLNIMLFVSGIFLPKAFLPKYLKFISYFSPLTYTVDTFRFITGIESVSFLYFLTVVLIFFFSGLILTIFSTERYFKV